MGADVLVLGYGNALRGDDGVGPQVARTVQGWGRLDIKALAVQQLTPELAEDLARARLALFVDAAAGGPAGQLVWLRLLQPGPDDGAFTLGHASEPGRLLALTRALFGGAPRAWLITIPARSFAFGETLSESATTGMEVALRNIALLVERLAREGVPGA